MTRNDTPDKLEWSIRPRSGTDWAQCDWGISVCQDLQVLSQLEDISGNMTSSCKTLSHVAIESIIL